MPEKNMNVRVIQKHDTASAWANATGFIPKQGELIVYEADETTPYPRFKVGNGTANVSALPFSDAKYVLDNELGAYVTVASAQTITGQKTFSQNVKISATPTAANDAATVATVTGAVNELGLAINKTIELDEAELAEHIAATNNPHGVTKAQVGLGNVDNVKQYSASNPPPYPVTSVAGKTGAVQLNTLTFAGAVTGSYNGSANATITIPTIAGPTGPTGADGQDGANGYTWVPTVAANGQITWASTQSGPGATPAARNIMGPTGADGADGNDGAAAGFGTPTVTTTTGNPGTNASVTVTANTSSPNTAKVFNFAFTIPRGNTGAPGQDGADGQDGAPGANGYTWIPSVSASGDITWTSTQSGAGATPTSRNIRGPQGPTGMVGTVSQTGSGFVSSVSLSGTTLSVTRSAVKIDDGEL